MRRLAFLLPLLLVACSPFRGPRDPSEMLVLCVENAAAGYGNIIARAEMRRIEVLPGQTVCREITPASPNLTLTAESTGGGAAGRLRYAVRLPSTAPGCWRWRLGSSVASQNDLLPCEGEPDLS